MISQAAHSLQLFFPMSLLVLPRRLGWFGPGECQRRQVTISGLVGSRCRLAALGRKWSLLGLGSNTRKPAIPVPSGRVSFNHSRWALLINNHGSRAASCAEGQPVPAGQERVLPPSLLPFHGILGFLVGFVPHTGATSLLAAGMPWAEPCAGERGTTLLGLNLGLTG